MAVMVRLLPTSRKDVGEKPALAMTLEPGLVLARAKIHVVADDVVRVDLLEPCGGRVLLHVVDAEGLGLPFATFEVSSWCSNTWLDLGGDVQRIDAFTDHEGRRILDHVDAGGLHLTVRWAGHEVSGDFEVREGEDTEARIIVR